MMIPTGEMGKGDRREEANKVESGSKGRNPSDETKVFVQAREGEPGETLETVPGETLETVPVVREMGLQETIDTGTDSSTAPGNVQLPNDETIGFEKTGKGSTDKLPLDGFSPTLEIGSEQKQVDAVETERNSKTKPTSRTKKDGSAIGSVIGNYEILSLLGRGGMGVVYKARHKKLNRIVALKMILHGLHGGSSAIQRFLAEAQAVAALQHPGIVQIFEIAEHEGLPYFSLEYVEGQDLQSSLRGQPWNSKPAAELLATLCDGMQYAHDHQILHRDIKPANILLDNERRPKISDFGLAKKLDTGTGVTKDGTIMGTPSYMPPEQARGDAAAISNQSDIYSLGAVLYQLLTGRAPFVSDSSMETLIQVIHRDPVQPRELQPGVPIDLETICLKALQKEPSARYSSCREFADDLRRFLQGEPISARPISKFERLARWCRRNPKIALPTAVASIFVLATAGVSLWAWQATAAQAVAIAQERDVAKTQKEEADRQRIIANQQQALAEENEKLAIKQANLALQNIQFMVSEVDTKLMQQPGSSAIRLSIMDTLAKKWDELDKDLTGGIRGQAIPTLMGVRLRLANTYMQLDRVKEADEAFAKLEEMARERVVLKEGTDASRMNLVRVLNASAQLQRRIENHAATEQKLTEAQKITRDILKNPKPEEVPTNLNNVHQLLAAVSANLAVDFLRDGKVPEAADSFAGSLKSSEFVINAMESDPNFVKLEPAKQFEMTKDPKSALNKARMGLGYVLMRMGKTEDSMKRYDEAIQSGREMLKSQPDSLFVKSDLASNLAIYGRSLIWMNLLDQADSALKDANRFALECYEADPEKTDLKRTFAFSIHSYGTLRELQERKDEALGLFERARGLREQLYQVSADERNAMHLMQSESKMGNVDKAVALINKLGEGTKPNAEAHFERACALSQLSRFVEGDAKAKRIDAALQALERSVKDGYSDPFRVTSDPDLRPISGNDRFTALVNKLKQKVNNP